MITEERLQCSKVGQCGGCPLGHKRYTEQLEDKSKLIKNALGLQPPIFSAGSSRLRDRFEVVWQRQSDGKMHLGLYELAGGRKVLDLPECPMASKALDQWFQEYREKTPPISLGTVRLRVSPEGQKGVWLDFANEDVKNLFEERTYLQWLLERAIVEIGQRRKRLVFRDGIPKLLKEPELFPWFETYGPNRKIPLYGVLGGFTQVGFKVNQLLVEKVVEAVSTTGQKNWLELFAGSGNFSLALADRGFKVRALENDELAVQAMERSRIESAIENMEIVRADLYAHPHKVGSLAGHGLLVDPPRSGLGKVLPWLESQVEKPQHIVYVSCFTESFLADAEKLRAQNYLLKSLIGVDQFPHSQHVEWVAVFAIK